MEGLGTCYLGTTTYNASQISDALALPSDVIPVITVTVGYPAETPELQDRLPLDAVVHSESYHNPTDAEIREFYAAEEATPASMKFVTENGKQNLAQVLPKYAIPKPPTSSFHASTRNSSKIKEYLCNFPIPNPENRQPSVTLTFRVTDG